MSFQQLPKMDRLRITILADDEDSYRVSETTGQLVVDIIDSTPTVTIESIHNNISVIEGDSFMFTIKAYPMQASAADPSVT